MLLLLEGNLKPCQFPLVETNGGRVRTVGIGVPCLLMGAGLSFSEVGEAVLSVAAL